MHSKNILHRDIKPANVFIRENNDNAIIKVAIGDFGLACMPEEQPDELEVLCGSPGFIDPSIVRGEALFSESSDIFSLGCLIYMLISGGSSVYGESISDEELLEISAIRDPREIVRKLIIAKATLLASYS